MLVLSRKVGETVRIARDIVVVVRQIKGDRVSVGIEAPKSVRVLRGELQPINRQRPVRDARAERSR
jgi:carbon storage regulator